MHTPKPALFGLALIGAALLGWMIHTATAESADSHWSAEVASSRAASATMPGGERTGLAPESLHLKVFIVESESTLAREPFDAQPSGRNPSTDVAARAGPPDRQIEHLAPRTMGERRASDDPVSTSTNPSRTSQGEGPYIIANGDHIVIASDGSIVSVGDNTVVKGNTGDAVASGTIAIDVDQSELTSGDSTLRAAIPAALRGPGAWTTSATRTVDRVRGVAADRHRTRLNRSRSRAGN